MARALPRQCLALLLIPLIPAILSGAYHPKRTSLSSESVSAGEIALPDALRLGAKALWIDARDSADYAAGHVPGAIPLNEDDWDHLLEPVLDQWSQDRVTIVYCDSLKCQASHEVAARLRDEVGLSSVYVLKGGWQAWRKGTE